MTAARNSSLAPKEQPGNGGRDPLITLDAAIRLLGLGARERDVLKAALGRPDLRGGVGNRGSINLYRRSRVVAYGRKRSPQTGRPAGSQTTGPTARRQVCAECGRVFSSTNSAVCHACRAANRPGPGRRRGTKHDFTDPDPWGTMLPVRKQIRRCPDCGAELFEGQYRCEICREKKKHLYRDGAPLEEYQVCVP